MVKRLDSQSSVGSRQSSVGRSVAVGGRRHVSRPSGSLDSPDRLYAREIPPRSRIGTPSVRALSSLLPASSPAIRAVVFLLTDAGHLAAEGLDRRLRRLASHGRQRPGEHVRLAAQWPRSLRHSRGLALHVDAGVAEPIDQRSIVGLVSERSDGCSDAPDRSRGPPAATRATRPAADPSSGNAGPASLAAFSPTCRMPSA